MHLLVIQVRKTTQKVRIVWNGHDVRTKYVICKPKSPFPSRK